MGRHAAPEGASAHPLVAAALAQRAGGQPAREGNDPEGDLGGLGWPVPPRPGDGGVGWPATDADEGPLAPDKAAPGEAVPEEHGPEEHGPEDRAPEDRAPEEPGPAARRRGWRRLFGLSAA